MLKCAVAFLVALSGVAHASFVDDRALNDGQRYDLCLKQTHEDAGKTYEEALAWHDAGGGPAAMHCSAVALVQLKQYAQAGFKLDALARERDARDAELRADRLDEARKPGVLARH